MHIYIYIYIYIYYCVYIYLDHAFKKSPKITYSYIHRFQKLFAKAEEEDASQDTFGKDDSVQPSQESFSTPVDALVKGGKKRRKKKYKLVNVHILDKTFMHVCACF